MLVHKQDLQQLMKRCRARGLRTVLGGPVTSGVADIRQYADHVVVGEAEDLVPELVRDLESGTAKPLYTASNLPDLTRTPLPDLRTHRLT